MKALVIILSTLCLLAIACNTSPEQVSTEANLPDHHTSQLSIDLEGTYFGALPCADCESLETEIVLKKDSFIKMTKYMGKDDSIYMASGVYEWVNGNNIRLLQVSPPNMYRVGEGFLQQLDIEGKIIGGDMAQKYYLRLR